MKRINDGLMNFVMLALLGVNMAFSVGHLVMAQSSFDDSCGSLQCEAQEDCGGDAKVCFCNRPSGGCFKPDDDLPGGD